MVIGVTEICVLILTVLAILVAIYLVGFLRSLSATLKRTQTVMDNVDHTLKIINEKLPPLAEEASQVVANVNGITKKVDHGVGVGMSVLEKTPMTAIYTIFGLGRTVAKMVGSRKKNKKK
ncbi:MAG: hypothetical protein FWG14_03470 [Peptococcaceae bacterium]|nr:hypothetical protein [Peptococcaceae bacterium]